MNLFSGEEIKWMLIFLCLSIYFQKQSGVWIFLCFLLLMFFFGFFSSVFIFTGSSVDKTLIFFSIVHRFHIYLVWLNNICKIVYKSCKKNNIHTNQIWTSSMFSFGHLELVVVVSAFGIWCPWCCYVQVDHLIGKDHLFKRSIILIKAWCYYESRILGAHHGLISTYALETLVLYIFHLFHASLNGPLAVSAFCN